MFRLQPPILVRVRVPLWWRDRSERLASCWLAGLAGPAHRSARVPGRVDSSQAAEHLQTSCEGSAAGATKASATRGDNRRQTVTGKSNSSPASRPAAQAIIQFIEPKGKLPVSRQQHRCEFLLLLRLIPRLAKEQIATREDCSRIGSGRDLRLCPPKAVCDRCKLVGVFVFRGLYPDLCLPERSRSVAERSQDLLGTPTVTVLSIGVSFPKTVASRRAKASGNKGLRF